MGFATTAQNSVRGALYARPLTVNVDVKHTHFQRLAFKRKRALERGFLFTEPDSKVPASIRIDGRSVPVRMRLKGDEADHLRGEKWSFRIEAEGENTVLGMRSFSLQHPVTRGYLDEWIFHKLLEKEDIIRLRYSFVKLLLNGKDYGVYAVEEHFDKHLLEHNRRPVGPIIRFSEDLLWSEVLKIGHVGEPLERVRSSSGAFEASLIDAFNTNATLSDSMSRSQFLRASTVLESFRQGTISTSEAFDVERLASFYAISTLYGNNSPAGHPHGTLWNNVRFYFNPTSSRLEPVGYDADAVAQLVDFHFVDAVPSQLREAFFRDLAFVEAYQRALERVSDRSYLREFLAGIETELASIQDIIHSEFPAYAVPIELLYRNQTRIRNAFEPAQAVRAYWSGARDGVVRTEIGNLQSLPVKILGGVYRDSVRLELQEPMTLLGRKRDSVVVHRAGTLLLPDGWTWADSMVADLQVSYAILGTSRMRTVPLIPHARLVPSFVDQDLMRMQPNARKFAFLTVDDANGRITIHPGSWIVAESLILPGGFTVVGGPGTHLDLREGAMIVSRSPLQLTGTADEPIRITSTDSTGRGLVVLEAKARSVLRNVVVDNQGEPAYGSWSVPGAVTFYKSPVTISNGTFAHSRSVEGLSIVSTTFDIDHTIFRNSASDAFTGDYAQGRITNSWFTESGGDAIDVSGSEIGLADTRIHEAGGTGLSASERSRLHVSSTEIARTEIAVASKDASTIRLDDTTIASSRVGITVFQTGMAFGPAAVEARTLSMDGTQVEYILERGSSLHVDGETWSPNEANVEAVYTRTSW